MSKINQTIGGGGDGSGGSDDDDASTYKTHQWQVPSTALCISTQKLSPNEFDWTYF